MPQITTRTMQIQQALISRFGCVIGSVGQSHHDLALFIEQQIEHYATEAKTRAHRGVPTDIKVIAEADFSGARLAVAEWLKMASEGGVSASGATATELAGYTELQRLTVGARLTELSRMGYAVDSGKRRPNPSTGKPQIVWTWASTKETA